MSKDAKPKIGQGAAMAAVRQGAKELSAALKAFPDSMPIIEEPGQILNATPVEISQQTGHSQMVNFAEPGDQGKSLVHGPESMLGKAMESIHQMPEMEAPEREMEH